MAIRENRSVSRSLFTPGSKKYRNIGKNLGAREAQLLFLVLLANADDLGRLEGNPEDVVALCPWLLKSEKCATNCLKNLERVDLIERYCVLGDKYIEIVGFVENQSWYGVSNRTSKIPPKDGLVGEHQNSARPVVAEFGSKTATPPKSILYSSNTYTKNSNSTATATSHDSEDAYRRAKKIFRSKVGKSIGSLSNRVSQWDGLVRDHGCDVIVSAVEIWATELGKGGRALGWPLAVFLKNADEFIEAAKSTESEQKETGLSEDAVAAAIAADDAATQEENEEFLRRKQQEDELAEQSKGVLF